MIHGWTYLKDSCGMLLQKMLYDRIANTRIKLITDKVTIYEASSAEFTAGLCHVDDVPLAADLRSLGDGIIDGTCDDTWPTCKYAFWSP